MEMKMYSWEPRAFLYHNFLVTMFAKIVIQICYMLDQELNFTNHHAYSCC